MERACLAGGQVCPAENAADEDHGVLPLELRVVDRVEVPVYMTIQVSHIRWRCKLECGQGHIRKFVTDDTDRVRVVEDRVLLRSRDCADHVAPFHLLIVEPPGLAPEQDRDAPVRVLHPFAEFFW